MRPVRSILKASVLAAILGGCVASAGVGYHANVVVPSPPVATVEVNTAPPPTATVEVNAPTATVEEQPVAEVEYQEPASYVYVNPNVQVIEDYDYPVFFSGGLYWRNDGGVWYSSSYHDRGWVTGVEAPVYIRSIERPEHFVHYRADVHATVGQPGYRYHPTAPVHHTAPPPRYVEHPGHPVTAHPQPQPQHTMQPEHHPVEQHPQPQPQHTMQPEHHPVESHPQPQPAAHKPDLHPQQAQPSTVKAPPPTHAAPAAPPPKKKK